jgi:ubiquinone/menaquinone biosynthesis C-methylase UbiE
MHRISYIQKNEKDPAESGYLLMSQASVSKIYIALRTKESRLYTDAAVSKLPEVNHDHIHYKEWKVRQNSCKVLIKYIRKKKRPLHILEVGCGNGWLANKISEVSNVHVTGLDINTVELAQAARVFMRRSNLQLIHGDLRSGTLAGNEYDLVIFAASLQYFPSAADIIRCAQALLREDGEVILMDTIFYTEDQLPAARKRTAAYFEGIGFPQMSAWYFHHSLHSLQGLNYKVISKPANAFKRFFGYNDPFHRILIKAGNA